MEVHFDCVSHAFPGKPQVLHNITFTVSEGTCTGLIGASGCGKTTLGQMVPRFYDPTGGTVFIDGRPLPELSANSVRRRMGVIFQQPVIFTGTVRENLRLERDLPDARLAEMIDLVRPGLWDTFVHGLDTEVGEGGIRLSGGEKQCVAIMRALLREPEFLLIDEATSSQDPEGQLIVQEALKVVLGQGLTAIMIAHRLSTTRDCDNFVVLKRLQECGENEPQIEATGSSHEELCRCSPTFRRYAELEGLRFDECPAREARRAANP